MRAETIRKDINNIVKSNGFKEYAGVEGTSSGKRQSSHDLLGALEDLMEIANEWTEPEWNDAYPLDCDTESISIGRMVDIQQGFRLPARKLALLHQMYQKAGQTITRKYGLLESFLEYSAEIKNILISEHNSKFPRMPPLRQVPFDQVLLRSRLEMMTSYTEQVTTVSIR